MQRDPTVVKQLDQERLKIERSLPSLFQYMMDQGDIKEHVFDPVTQTQNMIISYQSFLELPSLRKVLEQVGWVEKEMPKEDEQEKKEFYDAVFKGGSMH